MLKRSKRPAVRIGLLALGFAIAVSFSAEAADPMLASNMRTAQSGAHDTDSDGLRDAFERRNGLDPDRRDSDGDGLLDLAEDLDQDGLSNLGEQTFQTNPRVRDTDGDGIPDAMDDANHDGIADWTEQDRRPVPARLTPPLTDDTHAYLCYQPGVGSTGKCVGDPLGTTHIAIYGDSHSGQWLPALDHYAMEHHWRLSGETTSGCPSVHVDPPPDATFAAGCRTWREGVEAEFWLHPPDLVIITNFSHYGNSAATWRTGLTAEIQALSPKSRVLVLADTPQFLRVVPKCLEHHPRNVGACEVPRSIGIRPNHDALEADVAKANGATFASMNPWVCPYMLCPAVVGHCLLWRDSNHLTTAYSEKLAGALGALLPADLPR